MSAVIDVMLTYFSDSKKAGSYFLLFLVSLLVIWYINRQKNKWLITYGIVMLILAVMNPVTVWVLSLVFGIAVKYESITWLIPLLFYIPYAVTELMDYVKSAKKRNLVLVIMVFLISISGNLFGFYNPYTHTSTAVVTDEEKQIVEFLNSQNASLVLADDSLISAISNYGNKVPLMYGRDLWTMNMDAGIMDGYNEEAYSLYDAMRCTKENITFIADTASICGCEIIVIDRFDGYGKKIDAYDLVLDTDNYLVYKQGLQK